MNPLAYSTGELRSAVRVERMELNDPDKFLVRLRNVVDVLVQDQWWFDREALQAQIPGN